MALMPKHLVTMVACVCAAVVLTPAAVVAAGSLVTIADPATNSAARVSKDGALRVESRAGASGDSFNAAAPSASSLSFVKVYEANGPKRPVITDLSVSADTSTSQATAGYAVRIEWVVLTRTSGVAPCAYNSAGWVRRTLRWMDVAPTRTEQLTFPGSPLLLPAVTAGQRNCIGFQIWVLPASTTVFGAAAGYLLTP